MTAAALSTPRPMRARLALWWLAACLVLGPALGRMHQVLHGPLAMRAAAALQHVPGQEAQPGHGHSGMQALFHGHASADCELLDQLLFGGALLPPALLVAALAAAPLAAIAPPSGIDARRQRSFLARAPPPLASA